jgi:hypothetical protein
MSTNAAEIDQLTARLAALREGETNGTGTPQENVVIRFPKFLRRMLGLVLVELGRDLLDP